jgi:hypothetical protein
MISTPSILKESHAKAQRRKGKTRSRRRDGKQIPIVLAALLLCAFAPWREFFFLLFISNRANFSASFSFTLSPMF